MNYAEAKARKHTLDKAAKETGQHLSFFPSGFCGITPPSVKESTEYKAAKMAYKIASDRLRAFNALFFKQYKAEIKADRLRAGG